MPRPAIALALLVATALMAGCGKKGPPLPPEPRGPLRPGDVVARQIGDRAVVSFEVPKPRGPKASQDPVRAELVRIAYPPGGPPPQDPYAFRLRGEIVATVDGDPLRTGNRERLVETGLGSREGWTLRYAIRVRDRRGRPSALVVARDLVPGPVLEPPRGVRAEATADGIRLRWDGDGSVGARFHVYRVEGDADAGERPLTSTPLETTEYLDATVVWGGSYRYFVRRVGDAERTESASSAPVDVVAEDRFAPKAPTGLVAVQEGPAVRLFWDPGDERDLAGYRVERRRNDGAWRRIGPDVLAEPLLLDSDVSAGDRLTYRVYAVDRAERPNESPASAEASTIVLEEGGGRIPR